MPSIGDIFINIQAGTAAFTTGVAKINANLLGMQVVVDSAFNNINRAFRAAQSAVDLTVGRFQKLAEQIDNAQDVTGLAAESLSGMKFAAESVGVSFDSVTRGMGIFASKLDDARKGSGEASATFQRLGISQADLAAGSKNLEPLLLKISDAFKGNTSAVEQAAIARDLFGKGGPEMIDFLNLGSEGIAMFSERAKELGIVLDEAAIKRAKEFRIAMMTLDNQWKALNVTIGEQAIPVLISWSLAAEATAKTIEGPLRAAFIAWKTGFRVLPQQNPFVSFTEQLGKASDRLAITMQAVMAAARVKGQFAPLGLNPESAKALRETLEIMGDFSKPTKELEQLVLAWREMNHALQISLPNVDLWNDAVLEMAAGIERTNLQLLPWEKSFSNVSERLKDLQPQLQDVLKGQAQRWKEISAAARDFSHVIGQAFEDAILSGKGLRGVLAGLAEDLARILLRIAITKPLEAALTSALGGGAKGGILSSIGRAIGTLFGGRQFGGPVFAGQPVIVGEGGKPELFVPNVGGRIVSQASGMVINQYFDARGASGDVDARLMRAGKFLHDAAVRSAMHAIREGKLRKA